LLFWSGNVYSATDLINFIFGLSIPCSRFKQLPHFSLSLSHTHTHTPHTHTLTYLHTHHTHTHTHTHTQYRQNPVYVPYSWLQMGVEFFTYKSTFCSLLLLLFVICYYFYTRCLYTKQPLFLGHLALQLSLPYMFGRRVVPPDLPDDLSPSSTGIFFFELTDSENLYFTFFILYWGSGTWRRAVWYCRHCAQWQWAFWQQDISKHQTARRRILEDSDLDNPPSQTPPIYTCADVSQPPAVTTSLCSTSLICFRNISHSPWFISCIGSVIVIANSSKESCSVSAEML
jgi:hypothetical protein